MRKHDQLTNFAVSALLVISMGLSSVEKELANTESLSDLSITALTELCFARQDPQFHTYDRRPIGFISAGMQFSLDNLVDIRPAQSEFYDIRHKHEFGNLIGKLLLRKKLAQAEQAMQVPEDATPIYIARREFKNIWDFEAKSYRNTYGEFFHIMDQRLVAAVTGQTLRGSKSRKYEVSRGAEYLGQGGQPLNRQEVKVRFEAEYKQEQSPYSYFEHRPDPYTPLLCDDELRALLIKWGELDRPIQLEIEAA